MTYFLILQKNITNIYIFEFYLIVRPHVKDGIPQWYSYSLTKTGTITLTDGMISNEITLLAFGFFFFYEKEDIGL